MKKSTAVTLLISGALMTGCNDRPDPNDWTSGNAQPMTNNTYAPGYGYWHAPYHNWYPYPYNFYRPGYGYYHGGLWGMAPEISSITRSAPIVRSTPLPGTGSAASSHFGISRGGFGGSAHGFGGE